MLCGADADLLDHVELPDHLARRPCRRRAYPGRPARSGWSRSTGGRPPPAARSTRRSGQSLARPAASFSLVCCQRNCAVRFAEAHQHAAVAGLLRVALQFVVGPDVHLPAGHHGIAVGLRPELRHPLDVLFRLERPRRRGAPFMAETMLRSRRAAPHRPIAAARVGCPQQAERGEAEKECLSHRLMS